MKLLVLGEDAVGARRLVVGRGADEEGPATDGQRRPLVVVGDISEEAPEEARLPRSVERDRVRRVFGFERHVRADASTRPAATSHRQAGDVDDPRAHDAPDVELLHRGVLLLGLVGHALADDTHAGRAERMIVVELRVDARDRGQQVVGLRSGRVHDGNLKLETADARRDVAHLRVEARVQWTGTDRPASDDGRAQGAGVAQGETVGDEDDLGRGRAEDGEHASELQSAVRGHERRPGLAEVDPLGRRLAAVAADVLEVDGHERFHVHLVGDPTIDAKTNLGSHEAAAQAGERDGRRPAAGRLHLRRQELPPEQDASLGILRGRIAVARRELIVRGDEPVRINAPAVVVEERHVGGGAAGAEEEDGGERHRRGEPEGRCAEWSHRASHPF